MNCRCKYCSYKEEKKEEKKTYQYSYKAKTTKGDYRKSIETGFTTLTQALDELSVVTKFDEDAGYHVFEAVVKDSNGNEIYRFVDNQDDKYGYNVFYYGKKIDIDRLDEILERE